MTFESWVERQIREAQERGAFENLPGAGKPLADLGDGYDELWWIKRKVREEGLSFTPPALALRREVERLHESLPAIASERQLRDRAEALNQLILAEWRRPQETNVYPPRRVDVEALIAEWRRRHRD